MRKGRRLTGGSLFRTAERDSYYHIVLRVGRRESLADNAKDRRALNRITIETLHRFDIKLHAYCLMNNLLRALIEIDDRVLIEALRRVASRYSRYRNYSSAGLLFERPYTAHRVESDVEFLELMRFIHLNPVIADEVVLPGDYAWSSHRAYLGFKSNALIQTEHGLSLLCADGANRRTAYNQFMEDGIVPAPSMADSSQSELAAVVSPAAPDSFAKQFVRRYLSIY